MKRLNNILAIVAAAVYLLSTSLCCCSFISDPSAQQSDEIISTCCHQQPEVPGQDGDEGEEGPCQCCFDKQYDGPSFKKLQLLPDQHLNEIKAPVLALAAPEQSISTYHSTPKLYPPPGDRHPGYSPGIAEASERRGPPVAV